MVVLNLGRLEGVSEENRKLLATRIEEIVTGKSSLFSAAQFSEIEDLAQEFARKISKDKIFPSSKGKSIAKNVEEEYQNVDLHTFEQLESKSIGAEWLVKQTFEKLNFTEIMKQIGLTDSQVVDAQLLLTGKLLLKVYPEK